MSIQNAQTQLVTVNAGSGCIIQPMTDEYLYVLTAKHNIVNSGNTLTEFTRFEFRDQQWTEIAIELPSFVEGVDYFLHPDQEKDIAIIKIPVPEGKFDILRVDDISQRKNFQLLGYPALRRKDQPIKSQWYRLDPNIEILDPRGDGTYEAVVPDNATREELLGSSGGAILREESGNLFLAGIQNRMAEKDEQLGRIRFTSLISFDEIVALFPDALEPILPCFLKSFSFLGEEVFNMNLGLKSRAKGMRLTEVLRLNATAFANSTLVPHAIKKYIKENLPELHRQEGYDNYQRKIWVLWLELLTILNVVKSKAHGLEDFPEIARKVRIFYSNTDSDFWLEHLSDLHRRDYSGLDDDAIVVVASNAQAGDEFHILELSEIPADIYMVNRAKQEYEIERYGMSTTQGTEFPLDKYKFVNISAFKEGTLKEIQNSFSAGQLAQCIQILKDLYEKLIPNW